MKSHLYQQLSTLDQKLLIDLFKAAEQSNVTEYVHTLGYSRIITLVERTYS